jgi:hypothetical protein
MTQTYLSNEYRLHIDRILNENNCLRQITLDFYVRFDDRRIEGKSFFIKGVAFIENNGKTYVFSVKKLENRFWVRTSSGLVDFEAFMIDNCSEILKYLKENIVFSPVLEELLKLTKKAEEFQDTALKNFDCYNKVLARIAPDSRQRLSNQHEFLYGLKLWDVAVLVSNQLKKENNNSLTRFKAYFYCACYKIFIATLLSEIRIQDPELEEQAKKYSSSVPKLLKSFKENTLLIEYVRLSDQELRDKYAEYSTFEKEVYRKETIKEGEYVKYIDAKRNLQKFLAELFPYFPIVKSNKEIKVGERLTLKKSDEINKQRQKENKDVKIVD